MPKGKYGTGRIYRRGRVWWIDYYRDGEKKRESSHSEDRKAAVALLNARVGEKLAGRPSGALASKITVAELAQVVETDYETNGRATLERLRINMREIQRFFGAGTPIIAITMDRINEFVADLLRRRYKLGSIDVKLRNLHRGYSLLAKAKRISVDHIPTFPVLEVKNARQGFFERAEFDLIRPHLGDWLGPAMEVAYITGWRTHSEIFTRQWKHVDFKNGWLRLETHETKNGEGRNFKLIPPLRAVLEEQRERITALERKLGRVVPWVFPRETGLPITDNITDEWRAACAAAGFPLVEVTTPEHSRHFRGSKRTVKYDSGTRKAPARIPHDFRRTAVRNLELAGVPRSVAKKMVGHKTDSVYERYAIVDKRSLEIGGDRLATYLAEQEAQESKVAALKTGTEKAQFGRENT